MSHFTRETIHARFRETHNANDRVNLVYNKQFYATKRYIVNFIKI